MLPVPRHFFTHTAKHTDSQLCAVWSDEFLLEIDFLLRSEEWKKGLKKVCEFWFPIVLTYSTRGQMESIVTSDGICLRLGY